MSKSVVLVGFMGAGKTSTGTRLAARLGVPFVDTDALIEAKAARTITDIFKQDGEAAFRARETATLAAIAPAPAVYATGGGVVTQPDNWPLLKRLGTVVHLHGSAEVLFSRISNQSHRPLLHTANPRETFDALLRNRDALYRQADVTVDTDGRTPDQIVDEILKKI